MKTWEQCGENSVFLRLVGAFFDEPTQVENCHCKINPKQSKQSNSIWAKKPPLPQRVHRSAPTGRTPLLLICGGPHCTPRRWSCGLVRQGQYGQCYNQSWQCMIVIFRLVWDFGGRLFDLFLEPLFGLKSRPFLTPKAVPNQRENYQLKGTSTIYTLVKLRSVEPSPSFQDMAVISWTPSSWSLCFTKAQRRTVEVVSVKLPRNGNMEVSYIYIYIVYIYSAIVYA